MSNTEASCGSEESLQKSPEAAVEASAQWLQGNRRQAEAAAVVDSKPEGPMDPTFRRLLPSAAAVAGSVLEEPTD